MNALDCPHCGRNTLINLDGHLRRHFPWPTQTADQTTCEGSGMLIEIVERTPEQVCRDLWPTWRNLRFKDPWRFCSRTNGCTQPDGHNGKCTPYTSPSFEVS